MKIGDKVKVDVESMGDDFEENKEKFFTGTIVGQDTGSFEWDAFIVLLDKPLAKPFCLKGATAIVAPVFALEKA